MGVGQSRCLRNVSWLFFLSSSRCFYKYKSDYKNKCSHSNDTSIDVRMSSVDSNELKFVPMMWVWKLSMNSFHRTPCDTRIANIRYCPLDAGILLYNVNNSIRVTSWNIHLILFSKRENINISLDILIHLSRCLFICLREVAHFNSYSFHNYPSDKVTKIT